MNKTRLTVWTATAALALTLGACVGYVESDGGYVEAGAEYPARTYYYDPIWPDFVFFYDGAGGVERRHVFEERDGRRYHFEREGGGRRVYYDHQRALHGHAPH